MLFKKFLFLVFCLSLLSACVETVVIGTVATGAIIMNDGNILDLTQDSRIETAVRKALRENVPPEAYKNINVDVYNGRILLTGYVNESLYKTRAVQKAKVTRPGVAVLDEIMIFGPNYKTSPLTDYFISSEISIKLKFAKGIKSGNYEYNVVDGAVFIIGKAENNKELKTTTDLVSRIKGVKRVVSYILISTN